MLDRVIIAICPLLLAACMTHEPASPPPAPPAPPPAPEPAARPEIGAFGLDLTSRDPAVKAGDDFYDYADGHWIESHQIPADRSSFSSFTILQDRAERQLRGLAEALPADAPPGSSEQKVGDFYRAYLDTAGIEQRGIEPARAGLEEIARARTYQDLGVLLGRRDLDLKSPVRLAIV